VEIEGNARRATGDFEDTPEYLEPSERECRWERGRWEGGKERDVPSVFDGFEDQNNP
jgi:hypothetical protein